MADKHDEVWMPLLITARQVDVINAVAKTYHVEQTRCQQQQ